VQFWGKRTDFDNAVAELRSAFPEASGDTIREEYRGLEILVSQHGDLRFHTAAAGRWGFLSNNDALIKDAIDRAIRKGAGVGDEKMVLDHVVFEGYAPHKVPVLVEVYTDNQNRTAPEIRVLFKKGQLGTPGSNKFLFDHVGLVEAFHTDPGMDMEEAAIEAGANDVEELGHEANDDIPPGTTGARFVTDRTATAAVSKWLSTHGWSVVTSELGYLPKQYPTLTDEEGAETAEFLQALDDNDDVHRVWAAIR
jgi:transcriptional/translational regulatory protein YebC/TACO1